MPETPEEEKEEQEDGLVNENGHKYGCECDECRQEYWLLKH